MKKVKYFIFILVCLVMVRLLNAQDKNKEDSDKGRSFLIANNIDIQDAIPSIFGDVLLDKEGNVWVKEDATFVSINDADSMKNEKMIKVNLPDKITQIVYNGMTCLALSDKGTVWGWGSNFYFLLGLDSITNVKYKQITYEQFVMPVVTEPVKLELKGIKKIKLYLNTGIAFADNDTFVWGYSCEPFFHNEQIIPKKLEIKNIKDIDLYFYEKMNNYFASILLNDGSVLVCRNGNDGNYTFNKDERFKNIEYLWVYEKYTVFCDKNNSFYFCKNSDINKMDVVENKNIREIYCVGDKIYALCKDNNNTEELLGNDNIKIINYASQIKLKKEDIKEIYVENRCINKTVLLMNNNQIKYNVFYPDTIAFDIVDNHNNIWHMD